MIKKQHVDELVKIRELISRIEDQIGDPELAMELVMRVDSLTEELENRRKGEVERIGKYSKRSVELP